ncbi:hypothetical protein BT67DRAFT_5737 [Trichocladium antarcticum]|uniref:Vacuolar ATPase assembly protein VMA22 n=1 Tax=Trichocladium antarcticum TaxID=1450529 RepID=A0AAN6USS3_9PEZI|nr:hypothetical protein BT67DRAFT_5737 [Trichocladium antarcticum]
MDPTDTELAEAAAAADADAQSAIDALLQRYLLLLDTYSTLRAELNQLQASLFQHLARANFVAANRGQRYGQDYYDQRMQAQRRTTLTQGGGGGGGGGVEGAPPVVMTVGVYPPPTAADGDDGDEKADSEENDQEERAAAPNPNPNPADPLRWFGILTPFPLRQAQGLAIQAVEEIIPRLANVSAEMAAVELEVRRARKRRAKAKKAEWKARWPLEERVGGAGFVA